MKQDHIKRELYLEAIRYYHHQPWEVIADNDVFGLCLYRSRYPFFCSVLGNSGMVKGLAIYPGLRGYKCLSEIFQDREEISPQEDFLYEQLSFSLIFGGRNEVLPGEMEFLRKNHLDNFPPGAWPVFRSIMPGYLPWYFNDNETIVMYYAMRQAMSLARKYRTCPEKIGPDKQGTFLFRCAQANSWREQRYALVEVDPNPEEEDREYSDYCRQEVKNIRQGPVERSGEWEMEAFYLHQPVQEGENTRPYFPYVLLVMDASSGLILHSNMSHRTECPEKFMKGFVELLNSLPLWPQAIKYRKEVIFRLFSPAAQALGLEMRKCETLPNLDEARKVMGEYFKGKR